MELFVPIKPHWHPLVPLCGTDYRLTTNDGARLSSCARRKELTESRQMICPLLVKFLVHPGRLELHNYYNCSFDPVHYFIIVFHIRLNNFFLLS